MIRGNSNVSLSEEDVTVASLLKDAGHATICRIIIAG
jgi:hypothetical protein